MLTSSASWGERRGKAGCAFYIPISNNNNCVAKLHEDNLNFRPLMLVLHHHKKQDWYENTLRTSVHQRITLIGSKQASDVLHPPFPLNFILLLFQTALKGATLMSPYQWDIYYFVKNQHVFIFFRNNDFRVALTFWKLKSISLKVSRIKSTYFNLKMNTN